MMEQPTWVDTKAINTSSQGRSILRDYYQDRTTILLRLRKTNFIRIILTTRSSPLWLDTTQILFRQVLAKLESKSATQLACLILVSISQDQIHCNRIPLTSQVISPFQMVASSQRLTFLLWEIVNRHLIFWHLTRTPSPTSISDKTLGHSTS